MCALYKLSAYPKSITLRDQAVITVRPMERTDEAALLEFFRQIPEDERFFLKEDVISPKVIAGWAQNLDYDRALPLLAIADGRVVADATLIRSRHSSRSHIGEIRIVVHPDFRGRGLGTLLVHELCEIANNAGLERVVMEAVVGKEDEAIDLAERLGFVKSAVLTDHVKDREGRPHDLVVAVLPLGKWYEWWQF